MTNISEHHVAYYWILVLIKFGLRVFVFVCVCVCVFVGVCVTSFTGSGTYLAISDK